MPTVRIAICDLAVDVTRVPTGYLTRLCVAFYATLDSERRHEAILQLCNFRATLASEIPAQHTVCRVSCGRIHNATGNFMKTLLRVAVIPLALTCAAWANASVTQSGKAPAHTQSWKPYPCEYMHVKTSYKCVK